MFILKLKMGAAPYTQIPDEIFLQVFIFLEDRSLIKCSNVDRRFSILAKDNFLWKTRLINRFNKLYSIFPVEGYTITEEITNNPFKIYTKYHIQDFLRENLTEPITANMIEIAIKEMKGLDQEGCEISLITNERSRVLISNIISSNRDISLIKFTPNKSIKLTAKNGNRQQKVYEVVGDIRFSCDFYNYYKIKHKRKEAITQIMMFNEIIQLLNRNYYIPKVEITECIANKILANGLANIS
jgi:hypothetical protein